MALCSKVHVGSLACLLGQAAIASAMVCSDVKAGYKANGCCADTGTKQVEGFSGGWRPAAGPLNSVMPSTTGRPHFIVGADIDYPPYAYLSKPPYADNSALDEVQGVGSDVIKAMAAACDFDVTIMQANWADCWGSGIIGDGLLEGWYHACITYTHAVGQRNRYLEFSNSWATKNKPSGLIATLANGMSSIRSSDNLGGKTIVDVTGWAPTADTLQFVKNQCTGEDFLDFTIVQSNTLTVKGTYLNNNDRALLAVLEGTADAMWVYGDQADNYQCAEGVTSTSWNCDLWADFGTTFAYFQNGMFGWMSNGTTVTMSKKGSGISEFIDACLEKWMPTENFYDTCKIEHNGHNQLNTCIPNSFFESDKGFHAELVIGSAPWMFSTEDLTEAQSTCATGYCPCDPPPDN